MWGKTKAGKAHMSCILKKPDGPSLHKKGERGWEGITAAGVRKFKKSQPFPQRGTSFPDGSRGKTPERNRKAVGSDKERKT